jgi:predicted ATP-dependent endonuclease of OLD family
MTNKLLKFRVQNFKSIQDSGWIEVGDCSCLVGINEAGKTNLLLALWKLNPANDEPIIPLSDYPRKKFVDYEETEGKEIFIEAVFEFGEDLTKEIRKHLGNSEEFYKQIEISRDFAGNLYVQFLAQELEDVEITDEVHKLIVEAMPNFVYYSDYGNLDSEIYLPHVIENFGRKDLGERERAKSRSLKVLFDFVKLKPKEILELGRETFLNPNQGRPNETQIAQEREQKKRREILLQSASNKLTEDFKEWWKQGNYRFRFQADGNHFRIWVSDDVRTEEIELEGRSRGLQWFFSFFLVFLVESKDSHSNCILLLDEPGISLHPIAQFDLIQFFDSLAKENQLLYTTHSPFLVNPDNLADVKAVFIDEKGLSSVSADLRKNDKVAEKSIYPVHAAIGLTVSDTLFLGCQPILVEGPSDQIYLQLVKNTLLSKGKYKNNKEMVFIPTGGVKGMSTVISIVTGRDNSLPFVVLDADTPGKEKEKSLKKGNYKDEPQKIIMVSDILGEEEFEVEDLFPVEELAKVFSKKFRGNSTDDFEYIFDKSKPIINQMEDFAKQNSYTLELGWKVELARDFQRIFPRIIEKIDEDVLANWKKLFDIFTK